MIGHYLMTLTTEQEDRVLTESCEPYVKGEIRRCLVDVALGQEAGAADAQYFPFRRGAEWAQCGVSWVGRFYDQACCRFGAPRVNAAIRNRILSNRARRVLQSVEAMHV